MVLDMSHAQNTKNDSFGAAGGLFIPSDAAAPPHTRKHTWRLGYKDISSLMQPSVNEETFFSLYYLCKSSSNFWSTHASYSLTTCKSLLNSWSTNTFFYR